ncbi:MAG: hypothetical protein Q4G03_02875 [Planctomycetia bacterium]|nr:hypothetical protein [Planctomycetia bacterium]
MKKNLPSISLLAALALVSSASYGCSAFRSPSADYKAPGQEYCTDVSNLPNPEARRQEQETSKIRALANQYGRGARMEESPERLQMQADAYFEQKRYHDASRLYKKYLATSAAATTAPEILAVMHYRIGFVESKRMFFANAQAEYAQAVKFAPMNDEFLFEYGKASYEAGDYATADAQLAKLVARNPNYPKAQYYYGLTLLEGSGRDQAFAPLSFEVGQLQAYSIITDKYYSKGELQLAAQKESEMLALASQLGQQAPELPHKAKALARAGATYAPDVQTQPTLVAQAPTGTVTNTTSVAPASEATPAVEVTPKTEATTAQVPNPAPANGYMQIAPVMPNPQNEQTSAQMPVQPQVAPEQNVRAENNAPSVEVASAPQFTQIGPAVTANAPVMTEQAPVGMENNATADATTNLNATTQMNVNPFDGAISITNDPYAALNDDNDIWDDSAFATSGVAESDGANLSTAQQNAPAAPQGYTHVAPSAVPSNGYLTVAPHVPSASAQTPSVAPEQNDVAPHVQPNAQPTPEPVSMKNVSASQFEVTMSTLEYIIPQDYTRELNDEIDQAVLTAQLKEIEKQEALEKKQLEQEFNDVEPDEDAQLMAASTGYLPLCEVAYRVRVARRNEQPTYETPWQTSLLQTLSEATGEAERELAQNAPTPLTQASGSEDSKSGSVSEIALANVSDKRTRSRIAMTAHIGLANPGLFIASANGLMCRVEGIGTFRPGSIRNAVPREEPLDVVKAPSTTQTPAPSSDNPAPTHELAQTVAPEHARVMPLPAQTRPAPLAPAQEPILAPTDTKYAAITIPAPQLWDMLDAMDRLEQLQSYYNQPTTIEFDEDEDDEDFAFATSGTPQAHAPGGAFDGYQIPQVNGMFDDYQIPTSSLDLAPTGAPTDQASVNRTASGEAVLVAQNVPTSEPQAQTQQRHSDESVLQIPVNNTLAPTAQAPGVAPATTNATSSRSRSTPQERLRAAKASGAQVFELTPEQYRHVVTKGLGAPPPTK